MRTATTADDALRLRSALARHRAVEQVAVARWEDPAGTPRLAAYVVPAPAGSSARDADGLRSDHVRRWEGLWTMLYSGAGPTEPEFDTRGWTSSYDRAPLPAEQMRDWVDRSVALVRSCQPRSVLEIGCGSGLLLHRLAPDTDRYLGLDFSAAAVSRLADQIRERGLDRTVRVRQAVAHDLSSVSGRFDAVVMNSVVQYFPAIDYLVQVLDEAVTRTRDGGTVVIGDAYSLPLREAMQTSIVTHESGSATPPELLRARVLRRIGQQTELLLHPGFFGWYANRAPRVTGVRVVPKLGSYTNEMTSFRYDAVLTVGAVAQRPVAVPTWYDWRRDRLDRQALRRLLRSPGAGFGVTGIPNARTAGWARSWQRICRPDALAAYDGDTLTTDEVVALTAGSGYHATLSCASGHPDGSFDAAWLPDAAPPVMPGPRTPTRLSNDPLWARATEKLATELRQHLRRELGDLAGATTLICVEELPYHTEEG